MINVCISVLDTGIWKLVDGGWGGRELMVYKSYWSKISIFDLYFSASGPSMNMTLEETRHAWIKDTYQWCTIEAK